MVFTVGKVLLWALGGFLALCLVGWLLLLGIAGLAMRANSKSLEQASAAREAAFRAMTPVQHLALAQEALDQLDPFRCLALLRSVPEGTPGRAELLERATRKQAADKKAKDAMEAMSPEQHLSVAQAALAKGDLSTCRDHLYYVPRTTPGCEALMAAAKKLEAAQEAEEARSSDAN